VGTRSFSLDRFASGYRAVSSNLETDDRSKMAYFTRGCLPCELEKIGFGGRVYCRFEKNCASEYCTVHHVVLMSPG